MNSNDQDKEYVENLAGIALNAVLKKGQPKESPGLDKRFRCPKDGSTNTQAIQEILDASITSMEINGKTVTAVVDSPLLKRYRLLIVATDGAYINKTLLPNLPDRVTLVGRARRDAILYGPPREPGSKYGDPIPTPEQISTDDAYPASHGKFFYGGDIRDLKYKILPYPVRWRFDKSHVGVLRLIILMPIRYLGPSGKYQYNAYYYVLTNDLTTSEEVLIQAVLDRWQIEVLHRDLKHDIGLGEDQCRNPVSMARVPSMVAATYALVKVAAFRLFGPNRSEGTFNPLPRWRQDLERSRASRRTERDKLPPILRYSVQDLLTLLRKELLFRWVSGKARRR